MGLFDFLKPKQAAEPEYYAPQAFTPPPRGVITEQRETLNFGNFVDIESRFFVIDTETTGLSPAYDRMVEVAAIRYEHGRQIRRFSTLINPGIPIPPEVSRIHGITDRMVRNAPDSIQAASQLWNFIQEAGDAQPIIIGHNLSFDMGFLRPALEEAGITATVRCIDTLKEARKILNLRRYDLTSIAEHYGVTAVNAHRATGDALTTGLVMYYLMMDKGEEAKKTLPRDEDLPICGYIRAILKNRGISGEPSFYRSSTGLNVYNNCRAMKIKRGTRKSYITISDSVPLPSGTPTAKPTKTDGPGKIRIPFTDSIFEIRGLDDIIYASYQAATDPCDETTLNAFESEADFRGRHLTLTDQETSIYYKKAIQEKRRYS